MHTLIEAAPDRVVWATDWPHPVSTSQPPNEADLLELLYRAVPDPAMLQKILVDNPRQTVWICPMKLVSFEHAKRPRFWRHGR